MRRCVCPGSFDPVTNGHIDIIERASHLFDEVYVAVLVNASKNGLFDLEQRMNMLRETCDHLPNIRFDSFDGLLVEFAKEHNISAVVKGLRAVTDFDYEMQMAQMNHRLSGLESLFVPTKPEHSFLSSSLVKEVAAYGGDVSGLVPDVVLAQLSERLKGEDSA